MAEERLSRVFLFHPDKMLQRRMEKLFFASEVDFSVFDGAPTLEILKKSPEVVFIDKKMLGIFEKLPKTLVPSNCVVLNSGDPSDLFDTFLRDTRCNNVIGMKEGEFPRPWEVLHTVRRLSYSYKAYGLRNLLGWAGRIHEAWITCTEDLHGTVDWVPTFCEALGVPPKVRESFAELSHEILMNAVYDAVTDENGNHIYAKDRKADVQLEKHQYPLFSIGTDGNLLAVSVRDPFGGLRRKHVFGGLSRALVNQGMIDTEGGGAGLGMMYIYQHGIASFFTVKSEKMTEIIVAYDLSLNRREFSTLPKSVHFFIE
ncbi:MAG: hypothetical protein JXR95_01660 [Deltaproteobacteria bacterium]|nr:hypothetical protein [Deltaproteobacteria bacterium]